MKYAITLLLAFLFALPAQAQDDVITASELRQYKDPAAATMFSVAFPGGGQIYAGETAGGIAMAATAVGVPLFGLSMTDEGPNSNSSLILGVGAGLAIWAFSILDADNAARRHNRQHGIALAPTKGRSGLTLRVEL